MQAQSINQIPNLQRVQKSNSEDTLTDFIACLISKTNIVNIPDSGLISEFVTPSIKNICKLADWESRDSIIASLRTTVKGNVRQSKTVAEPKAMRTLVINLVEGLVENHKHISSLVSK